MEASTTERQQEEQAWVRGRLLGSGSFGSVHMAFHRTTGHIFAVKSVGKGGVSPRKMAAELEALENEACILSQLRDCPQIVKYLGDDWTIEDGVEVRNLHMELMTGGSITDVLHMLNGGLEEPLIQRYTRDILRGLLRLHAQGTVHGDIKGQNINGAQAGAVLPVPAPTKRAMRGTPYWMSPETARQELQQGPAVDIWSLGCTVVEMATGRRPWPHVKGAFAALYCIGCTSEVPQAPARLSAVARDFVAQCLQRDAAQRWTAQQLLEHPFMASCSSSAASSSCSAWLASPPTAASSLPSSSPPLASAPPSARSHLPFSLSSSDGNDARLGAAGAAAAINVAAAPLPSPAAAAGTPTPFTPAGRNVITRTYSMLSSDLSCAVQPLSGPAEQRCATRRGQVAELETRGGWGREELASAAPASSVASDLKRKLAAAAAAASTPPPPPPSAELQLPSGHAGAGATWAERAKRLKVDVPSVKSDDDESPPPLRDDATPRGDDHARCHVSTLHQMSMTSQCTDELAAASCFNLGGEGKWIVVHSPGKPAREQQSAETHREELRALPALHLACLDTPAALCQQLRSAPAAALPADFLSTAAKAAAVAVVAAEEEASRYRQLRFASQAAEAYARSIVARRQLGTLSESARSAQRKPFAEISRSQRIRGGPGVVAEIDHMALPAPPLDASKLQAVAAVLSRQSQHPPLAMPQFNLYLPHALCSPRAEVGATMILS
eukprot:jgi/Mesen1/2392/ME000157S01530